MLDIQYIREHTDAVKQNCKNKQIDLDIDRLLALDIQRRELQQKIDTLRSERNKVSKGKPSDEEIVRMREVGKSIDELEKQCTDVTTAYETLLFRVPNMAHPDAPIGNDEHGNVVVKKVGVPPKFSFQPKEHLALGEALGMIDMEHAAEVSGARFAYLKGALVLLEFALIQHTLSVVTNETTLRKIAKKNKSSISSKPFVPVVPPVLMRPEVMQKMGRLEPRDERYHIPSDDLYLVGSAEHTLGPLHMNETIDEGALPIRYMGFSTAFRREAGSYGKDTKGILRVHQFDKLEFESFTTPEQGRAEQDFIIAIQEHLMQSLDLPYQIVEKCTGDMGAPDYREFDIETWLPGQGTYRETHTSDYMTDYQARRLNTKIRYADGKTAFVHMNDATVFAIGRTIIAIMENNQQKNGTIAVPKVLRNYGLPKYI